MEREQEARVKDDEPQWTEGQARAPYSPGHGLSAGPLVVCIFSGDIFPLMVNENPKGRKMPRTTKRGCLTVDVGLTVGRSKSYKTWA